MASELTAETRENAGNCNFCSRGTPNAEQTNLVFPYTHVALLESDLARGTGSMRLCPACLAALRQQLEIFALPEVGHDPDIGRTRFHFTFLFFALCAVLVLPFTSPGPPPVARSRA